MLAAEAVSSVAWRIVERDTRVVLLHGAAAGEPRCAPGADWKTLLREALETIHNAAVVGAKRITADLARPMLFSMGEFVVHPKGFHHQGQGIDARAYRFPEEVDAITGGVLAVRRNAFDRAGGLDRLAGSLGAIALCLAIRAEGGRCLAVPQVVAVDESTPQPTPDEAAEFRRQWGFDWNAADLELVRQRCAGNEGPSGLLWHPRFHLAAMPFEKYEDRPAMHWKAYAEVEPYRKRADHLAGVVQHLNPRSLVIDLGCGDGLFAHLFALKLGGAAQVLGIDPEPTAIAQAQAAVAAQTYPAPATRPRFTRGSGARLDLPDACAGCVVMLDVVEHLPNPVRVLREAARVLVSGGGLVVSTPNWQFGSSSDPVYHVAEFTMPELGRLVEAAGPFQVTDRGQITGLYRDLVLVARRR